MTQSKNNDNRYRITQTLLSSWLYSCTSDENYQDFISTLNREKKPPTQAMLDGRQFENVVNAVLNGAIIEPEHKWYNPIKELEPILNGAQQQVTLFKDIEIDGMTFTLHGVLDFLKCGEIFDTKYSKTYHYGKYLNSPQHPMYFRLVPEAYKFTYLICDGKNIYKEVYRPNEIEPIEHTITNFINFLKKYDLIETYFEKWQLKK